MVVGLLERQTFPGRPNFESIANGDEAEVGFYLKLAEPICTFGDNDSVDTYPQAGITAIQLVIDQDRYDQLEPLIGMQISIVGKLYACPRRRLPLSIGLSQYQDMNMDAAKFCMFVKPGPLTLRS